MKNIHEIMFGELRPWIESNMQIDEFYMPLIRTLKTVQPAFNPHYELKFIRQISNKTKYFKKLIDNDIVEFCNTLYTETENASSNRILYKLDKVKRELIAQIKELSEIMSTQNFDLSYISSSNTDFSKDKPHKESTFIIFYLLSSLIRCYMEVQQHFCSFIHEDEIMEVADFYAQLLQQQAPANTFISEIKTIEIEEVKTTKAKRKSKIDDDVPLAFTYKHLNKESGKITDFFNSLKLNKKIAQDSSITDFKHLFSGVTVENPIHWTGAKSELPYLIKQLCNKLKVLEWQGSIWQIVCTCFVDKDGNRYQEENLKDQKAPKTTIIEIEKIANLMK